MNIERDSLNRAFRISATTASVVAPFVGAAEMASAQNLSYNQENAVLVVADANLNSEPLNLASYTSNEYKDVKLAQDQEFPVLNVHKSGVLGMARMYEHLGERLTPQEFEDLFHNNDRKLNSAVQAEVEQLKEVVQNSNIAGPDIGINIVDDEEGVYAVVNFGAESFNMGTGESSKVELLVPYETGFLTIDDPDNEDTEFRIDFKVITNQDGKKVALPVLIQSADNLDYVTGFFAEGGTITQIPLEVDERQELVGRIGTVKKPYPGLVPAKTEPGGTQYVGDVSASTAFNILDKRDGYYLIDEPFGHVRGWIPEGVVTAADRLNTDLKSNLLSEYNPDDLINFPRLTDSSTQPEVVVTPTGAQGRVFSEGEARALDPNYTAALEIDTSVGKVQIATTIDGYEDLFYNLDFEALEKSLEQVINPTLTPTKTYTLRIEVRSPEEVDDILSSGSKIISQMDQYNNNGEQILESAYFTPTFDNTKKIMNIPVIVSKARFDQYGVSKLTEFQYVGIQSAADWDLSVTIISSLSAGYNVPPEEYLAWSSQIQKPNFLDFYKAQFERAN